MIFGATRAHRWENEEETPGQRWRATDLSGVRICWLYSYRSSRKIPIMLRQNKKKRSSMHITAERVVYLENVVLDDEASGRKPGVI